MTCASPTAASGRWRSTPVEAASRPAAVIASSTTAPSRPGAGRVEGLITLVGGKLTTYRATSSEVAEHICRKLGMRKRKNRYHAVAALPGGDTDIIDTIPEWFPQWHSMPREVTSSPHQHLRLACQAALSDLINRDAGSGRPDRGSDRAAESRGDPWLRVRDGADSR